MGAGLIRLSVRGFASVGGALRQTRWGSREHHRRSGRREGWQPQQPPPRPSTACARRRKAQRPRGRGRPCSRARQRWLSLVQLRSRWNTAATDLRAWLLLSRGTISSRPSSCSSAAGGTGAGEALLIVPVPATEKGGVRGIR